MKNILDSKEKRYTSFFGEPVVVAHDVFDNPHVDIYIFLDNEETSNIFVTKGLDEVGFCELLMAADKDVKWPVYFLQAICNYNIIEKGKITEMETFDNVEDIKEANGFNCALFLDTSVIGFDKEVLKSSLGLKNEPLYVYPLTKAEVKYRLENGTDSLLNIIKDKTDSTLGSVLRESVV